MTRLIAFSAERVPVYSCSVPCAGAPRCGSEWRRAQRRPRPRPTSVSALSISAGESPCHTASDMSEGVFRIAAAAAESGALRIHGTTPASRHRSAPR